MDTKPELHQELLKTLATESQNSTICVKLDKEGKEQMRFHMSSPGAEACELNAQTKEAEMLESQLLKLKFNVICENADESKINSPVENEWLKTLERELSQLNMNSITGQVKSEPAEILGGEKKEFKLVTLTEQPLIGDEDRAGRLNINMSGAMTKQVEILEAEMKELIGASFKYECTGELKIVRLTVIENMKMFEVKLMKFKLYSEHKYADEPEILRQVLLKRVRTMEFELAKMKSKMGCPYTYSEVNFGH